MVSYMIYDYRHGFCDLEMVYDENETRYVVWIYVFEPPCCKLDLKIIPIDLRRRL